MNRQNIAEKLDRNIDQALSGKDIKQDYELNSLLALGSDLRALPSYEFKNRLKADLMDEVLLVTSGQAHLERMTGTVVLAEILPTLGGKQLGIFAADHRSFLVSFASHAALVLLIASGIWVGARPVTKRPFVNSEITFPLEGRGGGGSGDHSPIAVTKGTPPPFSEQQISPPAIVVRNPDPMLPVPSTVAGPPEIKLPQSNQIGDLMSSNAVLPSNGTGSGGAAGDGMGTGLGSGIGTGVGPGFNRGTGGEVFSVRAGVTAPRAIYDPEPEYSDEARRVKHEGKVMLSLVVDQQGRTREIRVVRSLGMGLDEQAVEAVRKWKFTPGMKDGYPVAVQVNVEVNFRLY
jgi:TonB family protein